MTDKHIANKTRLQLEIVFDKTRAQRVADACRSLARMDDVAPFVQSLAA